MAEISEQSTSAGTLQPPPEVDPNQAALRLIAMAETFRKHNPPKYKMAIKCLMASLKMPCSNEIVAHAHFHLGKLLWHYTRNKADARAHLEKSYNLTKDLGPGQEQFRLQVVCMISEVYIDDRRYEQIKGLLRNEAANSIRHPFCHAKLLLLFSEVYLRVADYDNALEVVNAGIKYFGSPQAKDLVVECYFRLAKSLILAIQMTNQQELGVSVSELGELLKHVSSATPALNDIRAFCYSIQLCYFLATGLVKNSKQCLRQLHMTVQAAAQPPDSQPHFRWLSPEILTALAYVLTVLCNIQYSNFERAHRYYGIALKHIESLRIMSRKSTWPIMERCHEEFLNQLETLLYEGVAQTHLIMGRPADSLNNIEMMLDKMRTYPTLCQDFDAQAHTLLGMYSFFMRLPADAERQFVAALKSTKDTELWTIVNLSLALVHLFNSKESDFYELFEHIAPNKLRTTASSLKSVAFFVHGLHSYLHLRNQECKQYLSDSIAISQEQDVARIQAMALLLLSKHFKCKDYDVLKAAFQWAEKSNDHSLTIWANSQIQEYHQNNNDLQQAQAVRQTIETYKKTIEGARKSCMESPHHSIVKWTQGPPEESL
ncbi:Cohesin loading factor [Aphelenchoides avenae]|nr:Cohesin loading factor [Aphelenchus avenae]